MRNPDCFTPVAGCLYLPPITCLLVTVLYCVVFNSVQPVQVIPVYSNTEDPPHGENPPGILVILKTRGVFSILIPLMTDWCSGSSAAAAALASP